MCSSRLGLRKVYASVLQTHVYANVFTCRTSNFATRDWRDVPTSETFDRDADTSRVSGETSNTNGGSSRDKRDVLITFNSQTRGVVHETRRGYTGGQRLRRGVPTDFFANAISVITLSIDGRRSPKTPRISDSPKKSPRRVRATSCRRPAVPRTRTARVVSVWREEGARCGSRYFYDIVPYADLSRRAWPIRRRLLSCK